MRKAKPVAVTADAMLKNAATAVVDTVYRDLGEAGSLVEHPHGRTFSLAHWPDMLAHAGHRIPVLLPHGVTSHDAALAFVTDGEPTTYVDILRSTGPLEAVKAGAFDASWLAMKDHKGVLVWVDEGRGISRETAAAVAETYVAFYVVPAEHAHEARAYQGLRADLVGIL